MRSLRVVAFLAVAVVVAVAAEEVEQVEEDLADQIEDVVDTVPAVPMAKSSNQGRTFHDWSKLFWKWLGHGDDYYDYYDYYDLYDYGFPSLGYGSSSLGYGSSFAGGAVPHYDSHGKYWSLKDIMINIAFAVVPVGLLLYSLPSGLFTIGIGRRSLDQDNMLMDTLEPTQVTRMVSLLKSDLTDRRCQEELFCELSRIGEYEDASYLQKAFYYVSTLVPDFLAAKYNLAHLFRITRSGYCKAFQCPSTSILDPPKLVHHPTDTDEISEVTTDTETETKSAQ